jgi:hypothetical protein
MFSIPKCFQNTRIKGVSQTQRCNIRSNTILHWKGYMFRLYLSHLQALKDQGTDPWGPEVDSGRVETCSPSNVIQYYYVCHIVAFDWHFYPSICSQVRGVKRKDTFILKYWTLKCEFYLNLRRCYTLLTENDLRLYSVLWLHAYDKTWWSTFMWYKCAVIWKKTAHRTVSVVAYCV